MNKLTSLTAAFAGAFAVLFALAGPAAAVVPAEGDRLVLVDVIPGQNPSANLVTDAFFELRQYGTPPQAGTQVMTSVYSCGQLIKSSTEVMNGSWDDVFVGFSPDGGLDSGRNSVNAKIGPSFEYYIDIVQPGYDEAYRLSGSYNGYSVRRPSCDEILNGTPETPTTAKCAVTKWSKAKGKARVGRMVKVTKTSTTSACGHVSYKWKVNNKTVSTGKRLFLKRDYKGDEVRVIVKVKGTGSKTLNLGRVR